MAKIPPGVSIPTFQQINQYEGWSIISSQSYFSKTLDTVNYGVTSRLEVYPPFDPTKIRVLYAATYRSGYGGVFGETPCPNPVAVKAQLQPYGATQNESGNDGSTPFTFSGQSEGIAAPRTILASDPLVMQTTGRFFTKSFASVQRTATPAAPVATATVGTGLLAGTFEFCYVRVYPGGRQSAASAASSVVTAAGGNLQITLSSPANPNDGSIGCRYFASTRNSTIAADTPRYDAGSGVVPWGVDFVYTKEPSLANLGALDLVIAGVATGLPRGGAANGGTGVTSCDNGEYAVLNVDWSMGGRAGGGNQEAGFNPVVVLGFDPARVHDSDAHVGDSILVVTADAGPGLYNGGWAKRLALGQFTGRMYDRSIRPLRGFVSLAVGGEEGSMFAGAGGILRRQLARLATRVISDYGTNSLGAGKGAVTVMAEQVAIALQLASDRTAFRQTTILPKTSSSDGYMALANQSVTNTLAEGHRRSNNAWILSTGSQTPVTGEAAYVVKSGAQTPSSNFYSGGNGVATVFLTRRPFVRGSEAVRVAGVLKTPGTDYAYLDPLTIGGVELAAGYTLIASPVNGASVTTDYTPAPSYQSLCGPYCRAWDVAAVAEVDGAGNLGTNGGWWRAANGAPVVTGTSTGSNSSSRFNDTTRTWTVNQYRGYVIRITSDATTPAAVGQVLSVDGHNATQISFSSGNFATTPSSGAGYIIYEPSTIDGTHPATWIHMLMAQAASVMA